MPRSKEVTIGGKLITVHEKRVHELIQLIANPQIKEVLRSKIDTATVSQNATVDASAPSDAQTNAQTAENATVANSGAQAKDLAEQIMEVVQKSLSIVPAVIAPELSVDDMTNAYPSEIEELVKAWLSVNFTGIQQLLAQVGGFAQLFTLAAPAIAREFRQK